MSTLTPEEDEGNVGFVTVSDTIEELIEEQVVTSVVPSSFIEERDRNAAELEETLEDAIAEDNSICANCRSDEGVKMRKNPLTLGSNSPRLEPLCLDCETELLSEI